jgi:capsular polysaccharide biosynthesis protein
LQARQPSAPVVVVEAATPPERQVFPLALLNTIVAGITGLVLGIYYALFCGYLERLRGSRIERQMQVPPKLDADFALLADTLKQRPSTP